MYQSVWIFLERLNSLPVSNKHRDHLCFAALSTGYSLSYGMCTALDALISQAYGAQEYLLMGLHTQRAMVILSLFAIPVASVWAQTEWILRNALGIDAEVASLAGQWAWLLIVGLWPSLMYEILKRFLQGQNVVWPSLLAALCRTGSVLLFSYHFLARGWGFRGLGLAQSMSQWVSLISLVLFMVIRRNPTISRAIKSWSSVVKTIVSLNSSSDLGSYAAVATSPSLPDEASGIEVKTLSSVGEGDAEWAQIETSQRDDTYLNANNDDYYDDGAPEYEAWPQWRAESVLKGWGDFFRLGIPGAVSLFIEWFVIMYIVIWKHK
jgi:hypothetical protein